jgi:hypothetical protein
MSGLVVLVDFRELKEVLVKSTRERKERREIDGEREREKRGEREREREKRDRREREEREERERREREKREKVAYRKIYFTFIENIKDHGM